MNIIYYICQNGLTTWYNEEQQILGCKIGSTCNIIQRMKTYITGFSCFPTMYFYEITESCYNIDYQIRLKFNNIRLKSMGSRGGAEFYDSNILTIKVLEQYLAGNNIEFIKKQLTEQQINEILSNQFLNEQEKKDQNQDDMNHKMIYQNEQNQKQDIREKIQDNYVDKILIQLHENNRVLVKAPTGFGKSVVIFKSINKLQIQKKIILILTPRRLLNKQIVDKKYIKYLENIQCKIKDLTGLSYKEKTKLFTKIAQNNDNYILTACYQSYHNLALIIKKQNITIDLLVMDEAHFIDNWRDSENMTLNNISDTFNIDQLDDIQQQIELLYEQIQQLKNKKSKKVQENLEKLKLEKKQLKKQQKQLLQYFLLKDEQIKNRLFTTATPYDEMILNENLFGKLVDEVKIYELMNHKILCDIETIVKKIDDLKNKKNYVNLGNLIYQSMNKHNKKKGIIYVNDCTNAKKLYEQLKIDQLDKMDGINVYIFTSQSSVKNVDDQKYLQTFENDTNKAVIISVAKISYGYDCEWIDFICFGDARQSDVDIRQICGRGLRWNKQNYPDKILHILIPIYKDEFDSYRKNDHLKKYLEYIIGECNKDEILKGEFNQFTTKQKLDGKDYLGDDIPIEICEELCTTGHNKFTKFMIFLKSNKIYDENIYNEQQQQIKWLRPLSQLLERYPKFSFQQIHPDRKQYYETLKEAQQKYNILVEQMIQQLGKDRFRKYDSEEILQKVNKIDNKIPIINFGYYYGLQN